MERLNSLECHGRNAAPYTWGVDIFGEKGDKFAREAARKFAENNPLKGKF
jgi:hypothetical protein